MRLLRNTLIFSLIFLNCTSYDCISLRRVGFISGGATDTKFSLTSFNLDQLVDAIDEAGSVDDLLQLCENIPAIRLCKDKSLRISAAEVSDAIVASRAVQRIANLSFSDGQGSKLSISLANDRRYAQLTECVEIQLQSLEVHELTSYLWGLCILGIGEDSQIKVKLILKRFQYKLIILFYFILKKGYYT